MKKIAYILLFLLAGVLGGSESGAACVAAVGCGTECEVGSSSERQWRCEQAYNSDLVLPRTVAEAGPVRTQPARTVGCPERMGVKCGLACGYAGRKVECFPEFTIDLSVGADPVEYYIHRRHRLII